MGLSRLQETLLAVAMACMIVLCAVDFAENPESYSHPDNVVGVR